MSKHAFDEDEVIAELRATLDDLAKTRMDQLPPVVQLQSLEDLNLQAMERIDLYRRQCAMEKNEQEMRGERAIVVQPTGTSNNAFVSEATGFRQQPIMAAQTPPEATRQQVSDPPGQGRRQHKPVPKTPPEQSRQQQGGAARQQRDFPNGDARTGYHANPPARR